MLGEAVLRVIDVGIKFLHQSHINVVVWQVGQPFDPVPPLKLLPNLIVFPSAKFHIPLWENVPEYNVLHIASPRYKRIELEIIIVNMR